MEKNFLDSFTFLQVSDVAAMLKMSKSQIYKLIKEGDLPAIKIRNSIRIREEDLARYIQNCFTIKIPFK